MGKVILAVFTDTSRSRSDRNFKVRLLEILPAQFCRTSPHRDLDIHPSFPCLPELDMW